MPLDFDKSGLSYAQKKKKVADETRSETKTVVVT